MSANITLTLVDGNRQIKRYKFDKPTRCLIGRANDCDIQLTGRFHANVFRHHCLFQIEPPYLLVVDLGSRNGTFVNGENIGERIALLPDEASGRCKSPARPLHEGDEIQVGNAVFRVGLASIRSRTAANASGTSERRSRIGGIGSVRWAFNFAAMCFCSANGGCPTSRWYSVQPRL